MLSDVGPALKDRFVMSLIAKNRGGVRRVNLVIPVYLYEKMKNNGKFSMSLLASLAVDRYVQQAGSQDLTALEIEVVDLVHTVERADKAAAERRERQERKLKESVEERERLERERKANHAGKYSRDRAVLVKWREDHRNRKPRLASWMWGFVNGKTGLAVTRRKNWLWNEALGRVSIGKALDNSAARKAIQPQLEMFKERIYDLRDRYKAAVQERCSRQQAYEVYRLESQAAGNKDVERAGVLFRAYHAAEEEEDRILEEWEFLRRGVDVDRDRQQTFIHGHTNPWARVRKMREEEETQAYQKDAAEFDRLDGDVAFPE